MDRGAWWAIVHGVSKSQTQLNNLTCMHALSKHRNSLTTSNINLQVTMVLNRWKWSESHSVVSDSLWPHGLHSPWDSPGQYTRVGSCSLLQGIFPTQGSNPGLLHCGLIPYQLSHKGSPRLLEWAAYPFSSRSSQPRNRTGVSCIAGGFFTSWANREALK